MTAPTQPAMWVAHELPERPLAFGACLCDCQACALVLRAEVAQWPLRPFIVKTAADPITVTATLLLAALDEGGVEQLLCVPNDYVREVFVASAPGPINTPWRSLTHDEDAAQQSNRGMVPSLARNRSAAPSVRSPSPSGVYSERITHLGAHDRIRPS